MVDGSVAEIAPCCHVRKATVTALPLTVIIVAFFGAAIVQQPATSPASEGTPGRAAQTPAARTPATPEPPAADAQPAPAAPAPQAATPPPCVISVLNFDLRSLLWPLEKQQSAAADAPHVPQLCLFGLCPEFP
jgi:hypothetical protein